MGDETKENNVYVSKPSESRFFFRPTDNDKLAKINGEGELIFFDEEKWMKLAKQFDEGMRDFGCCAAKIIVCLIDKYKKEQKERCEKIVKFCYAADKSTHPTDLGDMIAKEFGGET